MDKASRLRVLLETGDDLGHAEEVSGYDDAFDMVARERDGTALLHGGCWAGRPPLFTF